LRIAPAIVTGMFYAVLAVVAGSAIVAIGGSGIEPMRQRWENVLRRYDEEKPRVCQQIQVAHPRPDGTAADVTPSRGGPPGHPSGTNEGR
jgi:hypothetical protein